MKTVTLFKLLGALDFTYLKPDATEHEMIEFFKAAQMLPCASICIAPKWLALARDYLEARRLTTVLNFPTGNEPVENILKALSDAVSHHVNEIDVVLPYQQYIRGNKEAALEPIKILQAQIKNKGVTLKVIVESGQFSDLLMLKAVAHDLINLNIDYLKTSTGMTKPGATIDAVKIFVEAINECNAKTGIKISGGVRTIEDALSYLTFIEKMRKHNTLPPHKIRIGSSQLGYQLLEISK